MIFPVVVLHTTTSNIETRMVRDADEYTALVHTIVDNPHTVSYEVFASVKKVTRTVEWKEST
jgi:hypothetical protein